MEKTIIIRIMNPTKAQDALLQRLMHAFRAEHIEIQENTDFTLLLNTPPETVPLDRTNGALRPLKWCMVTAVMVH